MLLGEQRRAWGHYAPRDKRDCPARDGVSAGGSFHESGESAAALAVVGHVEHDVQTPMKSTSQTGSGSNIQKGSRPLIQTSGSLFSSTSAQEVFKNACFDEYVDEMERQDG